MKILLTYPPLKFKNKIPLLSQNRQFQWFSQQTYIYPVVPAQAATLLKNKGHKIFWFDGIAKNINLNKWYKKVFEVNPKLVIFETKTPVIKRHWKIINKLKKIKPKIIMVLLGDHTTALPEESFQNSQVDFILTGGNYDLLLLNLVNYLEKKVKLKPGIYYKKNNRVKNTGKFLLNQKLDTLPFIDRKLTQWKDYAYKNGNFKYTPGTYIMSARDCWWRKNGGCTFCSWTTLYPLYSQRSVKNVVDEIEKLVNKYKIKEIMDDAGTFPNGKWLEDFCHEVIKRKLNKKVVLSCNLRFGSLSKTQYRLLAKANFRLLLFGLESANQKTLDKLNKGIKVKDIKKELKLIQNINKKFNSHLEPHLTCMVGYPWENYQDAKNTISFCQILFKNNLIDSLQATIIIPYPGTKLFDYCQKNHLLKTTDWNDYDMTKPVIKTSIPDKKLMYLTQNLYLSALTPNFIIRKIKNVKNINDVKFLFKALKKTLGHILDFNI